MVYSDAAPPTEAADAAKVAAASADAANAALRVATPENVTSAIEAATLAAAAATAAAAVAAAAAAAAAAASVPSRNVTPVRSTRDISSPLRTTRNDSPIPLGRASPEHPPSRGIPSLTRSHTSTSNPNPNPNPKSNPDPNPNPNPNPHQSRLLPQRRHRTALLATPPPRCRGDTFAEARRPSLRLRLATDG